MATSPSSPPGVQPEPPSKRWSRSKAIDGRSRTAAARQSRWESREKRVRARSQREPILAWLAPSRVPGHARLRHDGGDPPSRQPAAAQKNETPDHGKKQSTATPSLIRWSIQEIRRTAIRLARKRIKPAHIIAGSFWRRTHQAAAQRAHLKKRQL